MKRLVLGTAAVAAALAGVDCAGGYGALSGRFISYLVLAGLLTYFDLRLMARGGGVRLGLIFALAGFASLPLPQIYTLGAVVALTRLGRKGRGKELVVMEVAALWLGLRAGYAVYELVVAGPGQGSASLGLLFAAPAVMGVTSLLSAAYESTHNRFKLWTIWPRDYAWALLYYVGCAAAAALLVAMARLPLWEELLILLPLTLLSMRAMRDQRWMLDAERGASRQFTGLQLGVLHVLAMALESREGRGAANFHRMARYAHGLGRAVGLDGKDLMAVELGALLHDIGKLAVPEYVLTKPGALSSEEFSLLKSHPVVGAEMIEKANLHYPVAPIVRAHHESWDGSGYPDGLAGERIPLGARILAVLDAIDAITSERPYRRGRPLGEALGELASDAGTKYDPRLVELVLKHHETWERDLPAIEGQHESSLPEPEPGFAKAIADARREDKTLEELLNLFKASLDLEGTMVALELELGRVVRHETMALYLLKDGELEAVHLRGENAQRFAGIRIPLGRGVTGFVAKTSRAVLNGMAEADLEFAGRAGSACKLRSALAVPLARSGSVLGVLTLYSDRENGFKANHLRLLEGMAPSLAVWAENSLRYRQAENRASTDALTGLPNSGALFAHLQNEIARSMRQNLALAVVVTDLDGFKSVNDRFGHLSGNRLLKLIANGLKAHCREYDFVARLGGDEFVLVLPGLDEPTARQRCARFEEIVVAAGAEVCGEECVRLSVGVACLGTDGRTPDELLSSADFRMYEQKQARKARLAVRAR